MVQTIAVPVGMLIAEVVVVRLMKKMLFNKRFLLSFLKRVSKLAGGILKDTLIFILVMIMKMLKEMTNVKN